MATNNRQLQLVLSLQDNTKKAFKNLSNNLNVTESDLNKLKFASLAFVGVVGLLGKKMIESAADFEQTHVAFTTLLGSAEKANTLLRDLSNFAATTPFEIGQLEKSTTKLLAFGFAGGEVIGVLKTLGDIASGVGKEKLPFMINALGQVRAKGRLMGQELLQFMESGIPLLDELANNFGVTTGEMQDMISKGTVGFQDVQRALESMASGQFLNLMGEQSKTLSGRISNLKDTFSILLREQGGAFLPWAGAVVDQLQQMANWMLEDAHSSNKLGRTLEVLLLSLNFLVKVIYGGVVALANFGDIMIHTGKLVLAFAKDGVKNFTSLGKRLTQIFSSIGKALTGNFEGAKDDLKNMVGEMFSNTINEFGVFKIRAKMAMEDVSEAMNDIGLAWIDIENAIAGKGKISQSFAELELGFDETVPNAMKTTGKQSEKLKEKLEEYSNKAKDFASKITDAFNDVGKKIVDISQKIEDLLVGRAKDNLSMREDLAQEYVKQEQKVADLQSQINKETDNTKRGLLEQELSRQEEALNQHKTIELAYQREIEDARRRASLTDFERTVEDLEKKKTLMNIEFSEKFDLLQKELTAEVAKFNKINEINKAALKQKDKFLADSELLTVDSINREIQKYNQLAQAVQRARSGQTSAGVSASAATVQRSQQEIGGININISDSIVSDEEGAKKIGRIAAEEIAKQIKLNQNFSFA